MGIEYNTSIVRDGLVLHLDAANVKSYSGSGTTWSDVSGQGNNATLVNGVSYSIDNLGGMVFDAVDDYAVAPGISIYDKSFSIEAWVKRNTTNAGHGIIGDLQYYWFQFMVGSGNKLYCRFGYSINGTEQRQDAIGSTNIGTDWTHVAVSFEKNVGQKLYVNGLLDGSNTDGNAFGLSASNRGPRYIGRSDSSAFGSNPSFMDGQIGLMKIYEDKALTAAEVRQNFNALRGRYGI